MANEKGANEKGILRAVLGPALMAMGAVALIAYFTSDREQEALSVPKPSAAPSAAAPEAAPAPAAPDPEPSAAAAGTAGANAAGEGVAAGAVPPDAITSDASAITPEVRSHAKLMIPGVLLQAVEQGNLVHVRTLREQLGARRSDGYLSDTDFEALDLVIDCMEHSSDARDEARDFLQFGASTILAPALKRACIE